MSLSLSCCRHASEWRARLDQASQAKAQLHSSVEALQKHGQLEDATAVQKAIETAHSCSGSLEEDIAVAQQALQRWQLTTSNEAKLAKALKDGTSVVGLSRAIQVSQPALEQTSTAMLVPGASSHCTKESSSCI